MEINKKHLKYLERATDLDGSLYFKTKDDVKMYRDDVPSINFIIEHFKKKIEAERSMFIIGNYFFFTLNEVKYWTIVSNYIKEEEYIQDILNWLEVCGAKDVCYKYGRLD